MPVLPIVRLGHPALRTPAYPIDAERIPDPIVQELVDNMIETMRGSRGVGLAAPQIGLGLRHFVYEFAGNPERDLGEPIALHALFNPRITPLSDEMAVDWEGCLSIPDLRGLVPRHTEIRVQALDRDGEPLDYVARGYEARIVQHELDHLNAIVFLDRMQDLQSLSFLEEWERFVIAPSREEDGEDDG